jgi:hypothetical protein
MDTAGVLPVCPLSISNNTPNATCTIMLQAALDDKQIPQQCDMHTSDTQTMPKQACCSVRQC